MDENHVINVCEKYVKMYRGDEATTDVLICMAAEILDISPDALIVKMCK